KIWLGISVFVALYAINQEFYGFFPFEEVGLQSEKVKSLLFIDGHWRKFSIYSDPVVFSYNMVVSALICFGLIWRPIAIYKKVILSLLCILFLVVMLFSGTRGAYVLFPAALILFAILNFNKKVMMFSIVAAVFTMGLIFQSTTNPYLVRFQTAFQPSTDASFIVRKMNQKRIQPYILSHPFGGGLGSVGTWGIRFAPNTYLARFPPDSGYARVAVELGFIGLFLLCLLMFIVLKTGIVHFFKIKDPELKNYCMIMTLVVFALNIGNYPQEALTQFPTNIYFCMAIALINATYLIDKKESTT
ncbi:MAG: O-antigen ligase family protein, partial [Mucilaginibacter sp.]|nr:O-antigen ligase family protein [Mucilaginibacter sp.]